MEVTTSTSGTKCSGDEKRTLVLVVVHPVEWILPRGKDRSALGHKISNDTIRLNTRECDGDIFALSGIAIGGGKSQLDHAGDSQPLLDFSSMHLAIPVY